MNQLSVGRLAAAMTDGGKGQDRTASATAAAMKEIETRFAAALLDSALPRSKATFGKGLSGSMAREGLVGQIARIIADKGVLGIGKPAGRASPPEASHSAAAKPGTRLRGA